MPHQIPRNTCCETCIPEFPDVTINTTTIQIGTTVGIFRQEVVDCTVNPSILAVLPIVDESVNLYVNGVHQVLTQDYTLSGRNISWAGGLPDPGTAQNPTICIAKYFASETGAQPGVVGVGTIVGFGGSSAPTGFLLTDGTVVSQTTFPALFLVIGHDFANDPADEAALQAAGDFRLPNLEISFLDPSTNTVVSNVAIIKF